MTTYFDNVNWNYIYLQKRCADSFVAKIFRNCCYKIVAVKSMHLVIFFMTATARRTWCWRIIGCDPASMACSASIILKTKFVPLSSLVCLCIFMLGFLAESKFMYFIRCKDRWTKRGGELGLFQFLKQSKSNLNLCNASRAPIHQPDN